MLLSCLPTPPHPARRGVSRHGTEEHKGSLAAAATCVVAVARPTPPPGSRVRPPSARRRSVEEPAPDGATSRDAARAPSARGPSAPHSPPSCAADGGICMVFSLQGEEECFAMQYAIFFND